MHNRFQAWSLPPRVSVIAAFATERHRVMTRVATARQRERDRFLLVALLACL